jgi:hypothetical protein
MVGYGHAQIVGASEDVEEAVLKVATEMAEMGADARKISAAVKVLREQTLALNAQQEALKRQLRATTRLYVSTRKRLWVVSSGALDTAIAAVGKDSDAAKNLRTLRSRVRRPRRAMAAEAMRAVEST